MPLDLAVGTCSGWLRRLRSHLLVDETVAFTLAQDHPDRRRGPAGLPVLLALTADPTSADS